MGCSQALNGIGYDCEHSMGGIIETYIINHDDVISKTLTSGVITAITTASHSEGGEEVPTKFKRYSFKKGSSSMTSTLNVTLESGVNYISTDLVLNFARMETAKGIELSSLAVGDFVVIVKDSNSKYWYLGYDEAVVATAGSAETGTARGDANKYSITLNDTSKTYPYEVDETIIPGLLE